MEGDKKLERVRWCNWGLSSNGTENLHKESTYNDTMVGDPDDLKPGEHFNYRVFKGFYKDVRWLRLNTGEGTITAMIDQSAASPVYVQLFTPKSPPEKLQGQTGVPFPAASSSFLHAIPAIGSKFVGPRSSGPTGQPSVGHGEYKGRIELYFGALPAGSR